MKKRMLTLIGLIVALLAWFNPLELDMPLRIALFIIGFDMMGIILKIILFWANFVFPVFGEGFNSFSWTLLILLTPEIAFIVTGLSRHYRLIIKPVIVFVAAYISLGLQPALAVAAVDLVVNLTQKVEREKKKPKEEKKEKEKKKKEKEKKEKKKK